MITQRMMVRGVKSVPEAWQFTVNTEATSVGETKTGIPLNLYLRDNVSVTVDWGDGTSNTLTEADYTQNDSRASVHEYAVPGTYTVQVKSKKWQEIRLFSYIYDISDYSDSLSALFYFRRTLVSLDSAIPAFYGIQYKTIPNDPLFTNKDSAYCLFMYCRNLTSIYGGLFSKNSKLEHVLSTFQYCSALERIPDEIFNANQLLQIAANCFGNCSNLIYIPEDIFAYSTLLKNIFSCFNSCDSLSDFVIHIISESISNANSFVTLKSGAARTIYVPSGSTTETTFNAVASNLGLTIIGE